MQLAIPSAPRPVKLSQIPGALRRVALVALGALVVTALVWFFAGRASASLSAEREFLAKAEEVSGQVTEVRLPPQDDQLEAPAHLRVIYQLKGKDYAASNVLENKLDAEQLFLVAKVLLLVDPLPTSQRPDSLRRALSGYGIEVDAQ